MTGFVICARERAMTTLSRLTLGRFELLLLATREKTIFGMCRPISTVFPECDDTESAFSGRTCLIVGFSRTN